MSGGMGIFLILSYKSLLQCLACYPGNPLIDSQPTYTNKLKQFCTDILVIKHNNNQLTEVA